MELKKQQNVQLKFSMIFAIYSCGVVICSDLQDTGCRITQSHVFRKLL